jgi:hypothetical protein
VELAIRTAVTRPGASLLGDLHLVALVRAGARFEAGRLAARPDERTEPTADPKDLDPRVLTIAPKSGSSPSQVRRTQGATLDSPG